jgi:hypothetical protein
MARGKSKSKSVDQGQNQPRIADVPPERSGLFNLETVEQVLLGVLFAFSAGFFFAYWGKNWTVTLVAGAICWFVLGIWLLVRLRRASATCTSWVELILKHRIATVLWLTATFSILAAAVATSTWERTDVLVTKGHHVVTWNRDSGVVWFLSKADQGPPVLSPVSLFVYIQLTNAGDQPLTVSEYKFSILDGNGDWKDLYPIPSWQGSAYWVGNDIKRGGRLELSSNALDTKLANGAIEARGYRKGWMLFELPRLEKTPEKVMLRGEIRSTDRGKQEVEVQELGSDPGFAKTLWSDFSITEANVDLSGYRRVLYSERQEHR